MLTNIMTLKSRLGASQVHWKWHHANAWAWFSIRIL